VRAADPDSEVLLDYYPTGLVRSVETSALPGGPSVSVEYEYDAAGNVTSVKDSLGGTTTYLYDGAGRLVSIRQSGPSVNEKRVDVPYSPASAPAEIHRFADLAGTAPVASTHFTYDCMTCALGLATIAHLRDSDGALIERIEMDRDPADLLERMVDAEGEHTYVHDGDWRLISVDHPAGGPQPDESYGYDGAGNRTSSHIGGAHAYGYSLGTGGNDIRHNDLFEYETDDRGNVARRLDRSSGAATEYHYDHRFRLTEVIDFAPGGAELRRSTYTYDVLDRCIRKVEDGEVSYFVYDGLNPILVLDGAGNVAIRRLYGRGLDSALADEVAGSTRWFLGDQQGSVREVVGNDGQRVAHHVYDSFGRLLGGSDASSSGDLGFAGLQRSPVTGLIQVRGRTYDPQLGRFLQMDPLDPHQYDFAGNSPMTYTDPDGRKIRPLSLARIRLAEDGPELFMKRLRSGFYRESEVLKRINPQKLYPDGYGLKPNPIRRTPTSQARGGPGEAGMYAIIVTGIGVSIIGAVGQLGSAVVMVYENYLIAMKFYETLNGL
jgi:RHS repeat-associated protein